MQFFYYPPSGAASSNPSVGTNGALIPGSSTLIAGENPSGNLTPLQTNASGDLLVSLNAPSVLDINLTQVGGAAIALGQALMAASLPVVIASNQSTLPISAASLPLPSGAATEATLAAMSAKLPATLGAHLIAASLAVNIASDQVVPVSASSLPLPSGAATEATLSALNAKVVVADTGNVTVVSSALPTGAATESTLSAMSAKLPATLGAHVIAASLAVNIASDQVVPISASALPLPSGAATEATLSALSAKFNSLGQKTMANSAPVVISSDQSAIPVSSASGRSVITTVRNDYSSVNVTTGAWVQLVASLGATVNAFEIFDSSGQTLELGTGAAASEVRLILVYPGGNGQVPVTIPSGTRLSIRAVSATANSGELDINLYS